MLVRDILKTAATELGIVDGFLDYINGVSEEYKGEAEDLLECFNLVENELALDYLPLFAEDEVETQTGTVYFDALAKRAVRIVKVTDEWDNEISYKLFPEYIRCGAGKRKIRYAYTPEKKTMDGKTDVSLFASERLFAYGVAAEYSLQKGDFEGAAVWDAKYKEAISAAYRARGVKKISSRRWV